jgi:hypothetical protein
MVRTLHNVQYEMVSLKQGYAILNNDSATIKQRLQGFQQVCEAILVELRQAKESIPNLAAIRNPRCTHDNPQTGAETIRKEIANLRSGMKEILEPLRGINEIVESGREMKAIMEPLRGMKEILEPLRGTNKIVESVRETDKLQELVRGMNGLQECVRLLADQLQTRTNTEPQGQLQQSLSRLSDKIDSLTSTPLSQNRKIATQKLEFSAISSPYSQTTLEKRMRKKTSAKPNVTSKRRPSKPCANLKGVRRSARLHKSS